MLCSHSAKYRYKYSFEIGGAVVFVISGFFLANSLTQQPTTKLPSFHWYLQSVAKRIRTLLVPYFAWNVVYYFFKLATGKLGFDWNLFFRQITGWDFGGYSPACGQFWYIRCLFMFVIVSPLFMIAMWRKKIGIVILVAVVGLWLCGIPPIVRGIQPFEWQYVAYFCAGVWIALHGAALSFSTRWLVSVLGPVFALSATYVAFGDETLLRIAGVVMIVSGLPLLWMSSPVLARAMRRIGSIVLLGFFIYAAHVMIVSVARKLVLAVVPQIYVHSIGYAIHIFGGVVGSVVIGLALRKYCMRLYSLLCGGRV